MCFHAAKIVKKMEKEIGEIRLFNESKFWPKDKLYGSGRTNKLLLLCIKKIFRNPPDFLRSPVGILIV